MPSDTHATASRKQGIFSRRYLLSILLICVLGPGGVMLSVPSAEAHPLYSCTGHCYAYVKWSNAVDGASTYISVEFITCGSCNGFVNNEIWYVGSSGTEACPSSGCWVETGYSTWGNPNHHVAPSCTGGVANCFFWAQDSSAGYEEHATANITQYGVLAPAEIQRNSSNHNNWDVYINGYHYTALNNHFGYGGTTAVIEIGEELYGTSGAASPRIDWEYNAWLGINGSNYQYQHANGNVPPPNNPPYGKWETPPSSSSIGGDFCAATTNVC